MGRRRGRPRSHAALYVAAFLLDHLTCGLKVAPGALDSLAGRQREQRKRREKLEDFLGIPYSCNANVTRCQTPSFSAGFQRMLGFG